MREDLSERKRKILQAIIEAHIADGGPVGSKTLSQDTALTCSPATIRNEMAELEEMGYLEQPHTSAGRVPSERGYRFYVDSLVEKYRMTTGEINAIHSALRDRLQELDDILSDASRLASTLTNYTSVAVKPRSSLSRVMRFEGVLTDARSLLLVLVFAGGAAKTRQIRLPLPLTENELDGLIGLFNTYLIGLTADELTLSLVCMLERQAGRISPVVAPIIKTIYEAMSEADGGEVRFQGVNRLLEYPEYADADSMKGMLSMFERKEELLDLIAKDTDADNVHVYIGKENAVDEMNNSALIYRQIKRDGKVVGAIGVIGPCRMNYSKVIETINQLAEGIDSVINEPLPEKKETDDE